MRPRCGRDVDELIRRRYRELTHTLTHALTHSLSHSVIHYYYCTFCYYYGDYCQYCFYYRDFSWLHRMTWTGSALTPNPISDSPQVVCDRHLVTRWPPHDDHLMTD